MAEPARRFQFGWKVSDAFGFLFFHSSDPLKSLAGLLGSHRVQVTSFGLMFPSAEVNIWPGQVSRALIATADGNELAFIAAF